MSRVHSPGFYFLLSIFYLLFPPFSPLDFAFSASFAVYPLPMAAATG